MKRVNIKRLSSLFGALILIAGVAVEVLPPITAHALATEFAGQRSLTLVADAVGGSAPGSGTPGNVNYIVKHAFNFTIGDTYSLGSISFQYCTTAEPVAGGTGCIEPAGLDLSQLTSISTLSQSGENTGFTTLTLSKSVDASDTGATNNVITIGRTTAAQPGAASPSTYTFAGIQNPTATNTTFFVRITTYTSTNGSGTAQEGGTVAASTANPIVLQGNMPESLVFCTGETVGETSGVPDCTTATSGNIQFNQLFSPTSTAYSTSQMAASTNAGSGYAITVNGPTLTSGTNTIKAMTTTGTSEYGVSQFGMNLALNDGAAYTNAPNITTADLPAGYAGSANVTPASNGTNYNAVANTGYNSYSAGVADKGLFTFNSGDTVANSGYSTSTPGTPGTPIGTDAQIYTVSYIANVPGSQPAGTYTTTLTYICTATF